MNNPTQIKRFIFTGTSGSRKTSIIEELEKLGHAVIMVIKELTIAQRCEFILEQV